MWAEAMTIYRSGKYKLSFSAEMNAYLKAHQQGFMQEDKMCIRDRYSTALTGYCSGGSQNRKRRKRNRI